MDRVVRRTVCLLLLALSGAVYADDDTYRAEIEAWRAAREARLVADDGWLTLAGLHWLEEGTSTIGAAIGNSIRLPAAAPDRVGRLVRAGGGVEFHPEPGVAVTSGGEAFTGDPLRSDADGPPDDLGIGPIRLVVIRRGDRLALRVKDNTSPTRAAFAGLDWFPIDPSWRV